MSWLCFFIFLFSFSICNAYADVKILEWKEFSKLNLEGRESKFLIKIQAINLPKNSGIMSFSITTNSKNKIEYSNIKVDSLNAKFLYQNGVFEIYFNKPITNNQIVNIEFDIRENYQKISKYFRQEALYIPEFANGSYGEVEIDIGGNFELISSHKNIFARNHKIFFRGRVPSEGIKETLKLTNDGVIWSVDLKSKIKLSNTQGLMEVSVPYHFRGGAQSVAGQTISANIVPKKHLTTRENDILTFEINPQINEIIIQNKAEISTGKKFRIENNHLDEKYLEISESDKILLMPVLQSIYNNQKYDSLPLHVKILNFVHDYISYDLKYYGKNLSVEQILQTKSGVCSEYATLFNALARLANIPSSIVHGYALGEYDKFESHAWNMIYINNRWIHVDPTWNLSSGMVSSSHIYLKDNRKEEIIVKFQGQETDIQIEREFEIFDTKKY